MFARARGLGLKIVAHAGEEGPHAYVHEALDLLKVDMDTPLEITTDGKSLIISPVAGSAREKKFRKSLTKVNREHAATLKKLAG